ncbi:MAG TPA: TonB-dependent receptor, partial [Woeseiaceae bacterium]|nr:TonB-dependent receptor [Woeseiaceae bacterium]
MHTLVHATQRRHCLPALALGAILPVAALAASEEDPHHDIEEIVVTATPLERTVEQLAQPTAVLSGDDLTRKQSTSVGETVSTELGVSSTWFGPVASRPVIRGQFGERVLVLANALDAMDASALSEDHAVGVDGILAERIEIVRGPATLLYGSGAAGGLVNVVDSRILEAPLEGPVSGALSLGSDSATGLVSGAGKIAFGIERIAAHLDYYRRDTDDVEIPGFAESATLRAMEEVEGEEHEEPFGVVENTDSSTDGGAAAMTFTGDAGFIGLAYSLHDSNYGIPGHEHLEEGAEEEAAVRIDLEQRRLDLKGAYDFDGAIQSAKLRIARNDYTHTELEGAEIGTVFDTLGTDARLEFRHATLGDFQGAFGLQFKSTDFSAAGEEAFVPSSDTQQSSLFLFEEWGLSETWTLQGSARVERQTIDSPSQPSYSDTAWGGS